ncbi:MAG: DNA polymerase III subunit beta [Fretibacterium sp.]|nr:DNA polymerase III subunit beta [Fretibacterium sp.]
MKLELDRSEFLKAWQMAERSSGTKSTLSAVNGILVTVGDETLLEATDFKTALRCTASGVRTLVPGQAILPVRLLGEFLKRIPTETATLEVDGEKGVLFAGRNRTRFTTAPVSEFPKIPRSDSAAELCTLIAADLARVVTEGSIASSTPAEFPKYLGACLFSVKDNLLKVVSTDGKRLSLSQCPCGTKADEEVLLPVPALKELNRLLTAGDPESRVQVLNDGSTVWFRLDVGEKDSPSMLEFSIRRIESSFPNYEKILTSDVLTTLRIPREELLPALERVDIISHNTVSHLVVMRLSPGGDLKMTTRAPDLGTALEVLDAVIEGNPLRVGFNVGYLQDGLRALGSGEVLIEFNGEEGQTRIVQEGAGNFLYMLMPARLSPQDVMEDDSDSQSELPAGPQSELPDEEPAPGE